MARLPRLLTALVAWGTWPLLLAGSLLLTTLGLRADMGESHLVLLLTGSIAVVLLLAQVLFGRTRPRTHQLGTDLLHMALSNGLVGAGVKAITFVLVFGLADAVRSPFGRIWPDALPLGVQVILAMVLGELAFTTMHRFTHRVDWAWPWHAVHHSSAVLYVFSAGRSHPVNVVVSFLCQVLPAMLLGARGEVLVLLSVFTTVHGMLQHTDLELRTGWLSWIFATPEVHRIHHSVDMAEGNSNFGSNLVLWDMVFGTFQAPRRRTVEVGIAENVVPEGYWKQLATPFIWRQLTGTEADPTGG